ncbi:nucleoside triphosphate pyrophosphohydrolase family protein [Yoonia sp. R2-816]|uniref:nucleoside triphosphate pyrophosphohydrolase family protein n=1 Tax=Yoonia sp. R2-816 TaxID=3342638 RepID=UPI0037273A20
MTYDINAYCDEVQATDRFEEDETQPILLGLFGEVGGVMSAVKKLKREKKAYIGFRANVIDELGDAFWYFTALARRFDVSVAQLLLDLNASASSDAQSVIASDDPLCPVAISNKIGPKQEVCDQALVNIGRTSADMLRVQSMNVDERLNVMRSFIRNFLTVLGECNVSFSEVLTENAKKTKSRFGKLDLKSQPDFDADFIEYEQLPRQFTIEMRERDNGKVYLRWNGVFIGDPLTDNIAEGDGFRYHDVIHFAHAAILHWSPTMRGLLKRKRKSDQLIDESQDGGRGVVVEEGLAAWLFSKAKELDYFEGHTSVSLDLLKHIQDFVRGYEVDQCPMNLWEKCILDGYKVFRQVRSNKGGLIIGDRDTRTLQFKKLDT